MTTIVKIDKELESIIPSFLDNRKKDLISLREFLDQKDYDSIETIGHRLAGNAGGYGFDGLGLIGKKLENAAQEKNNIKINELTIKINNYMNSLEIIYE